MVRHNWRSE